MYRRKQEGYTYVGGVSMSELIVYLIESGLLFSEMTQ
jgi:hypothetical protein